MGYKRVIVKLSNPEKYILDFYQKLKLALMFFYSNELRNHAAAAAYYMLLSLVPLVLVLFYIFNRFLDRFPAFSMDVFTVLSVFNSGITPEMFSKFGISENVGNAIGVFGILNLMFNSRLILTSIQRAFNVIFPADKARNFFMQNVISLCLLPTILVIVLLIGVLNMARSGIYKYLEIKGINIEIIHPIFELLSYAVPVFVTFALIYITYRYLPIKKPSNRSAFKGTLLFLVVFTAAKFGAGHLFKKFMSVGAYGLLGNLILIMVWSYFVFLLFYFCAQYVFVNYKGDMLILNKFFDKSTPDERFIAVNKKVLERYTLEVKAGETLFEEGDTGEDVYYVLYGCMDACVQGKKIGEICTGEFFGEMAHITGSPRSATVKAVEDCLLACLPPAIFDEILNHNGDLAIDLLHSVCGRLNDVDHMKVSVRNTPVI